jgi:hypothetical protein
MMRDNDGDPFTAFACSTPVATEDTDLSTVISCGAETLVGLDVTGEIRLYVEGDLARTLFTITNNTSASVNFNYLMHNDFGTTVDHTADHYLTSSGGGAPADGDMWAANDGRFGLPSAFAWGNAAGIVAPASVTFDSDDQVYARSSHPGDSQISIAPGETMSLAFFYLVDADANPDHDANWSTVKANAATLFASFSGRLTTGLDSTLNVVNWITPTDPGTDPGADPDTESAAESAGSVLATTGANAAVSTTLIAGTALLAVTGIALLVAARRRRVTATK